MTRCLVAVAFVLVLAPSSAGAHLPGSDDWAVTYRRLTALFPAAASDRWRIIRYHLSSLEAAELADDLGFTLTPHDRRPTFYVAFDSRGAFLGVAMFVEPHRRGLEGHARFGVGVGVGPSGQILGVLPYGIADADPPDDTALTQQLLGRTLASSFEVGNDIRPTAGSRARNQPIADAARESLLFMRLALGRSDAR